MSIESTYTVRRSNAIEMLREKGCIVYDNDCNERLSDMLYSNRESIFENYHIVEDSFEEDKWERMKSYW